MNATDGSTRLSLFIQVNSIDPFEMVNACEHIRTDHKDPSKEDYVYNVMLNEIGTQAGALHADTLSALEPYLPGGSKQAFDNVFVGSSIIPWTGGGNAYREGIKSGAFRWQNLTLQRQLWQQWHNVFGARPYHWYINYEGVLDYLDEWDTRMAMEAYLLQSVRDAFSISPWKAVLWSPAIWRNTSMTGAELWGVSEMFRRIDWFAQQDGMTHGINWLHLQDMMGRTWSGNDLYDVKAWYQQLKDLDLFDSLAINAELFTDDYQPLPDEEYARRMNFYDANGIPVRGSWELRHWYRGHIEIP